MKAYDYELRRFEASGATPLPVTDVPGSVENDGARIWYDAYGIGAPVILLHGGLGHSSNWGYQVPALIENGYRAVVIDSRGHGRSTRDGKPYSYDLMASDVLAVMNALHLDRVVLVGWSDGACTALILARQYPSRVAGVFFFACNMDPTGVKPFEAKPVPCGIVSRQLRCCWSFRQSGPSPGSARLGGPLRAKVLKVVGKGQSYREIRYRLGLSKNMVLDIVKRDRATARWQPLNPQHALNYVSCALLCPRPFGTIGDRNRKRVAVFLIAGVASVSASADHLCL